MQTYNVWLHGQQISAIRAYSLGRAQNIAQKLYGALAIVSRA